MDCTVICMKYRESIISKCYEGEEMNKICILIIDSGVDPSSIKNKKELKGFSYCNGRIEEDFRDEIGHGTSIYNIVSSELKDVQIINIKFVVDEVDISEDDLIGVLNYVYENVECNIINMSMGLNIVYQNQKLHNICDRLSEKGVILVSAFDNAGAYSYPAVYSSVIGVISSPTCKRNTDFEYIHDSKVNIASRGGVQKLLWKDSSVVISAGNSFACAYVTAQIAKIMQSGVVDKKDILSELESISKKTYYTDIESYCETLSHSFEIHKALLFPFNKEMHSIVRFSNLLNFEIEGVYDSKYLGKVGSTTVNLLNDAEVGNYTIEDFKTIDWKKADTLILGHLDELSAALKDEDIKPKLINEALENGLNIYSFDDLSLLGYERNDRIYWPEIDRNNVEPNVFGKLYRISKPVLGVWGTSSKQGKFTLQLQLRELLQKREIKVGQIGTEPSSYLFGMDYTYPMGYGSTVKIGGVDSVRYLNGLINDISVNNDADIILVGSQSGTIPYDYGNIGFYNICQYDFLQGTLPDAIILCINPYDDIEYVNKTISFIEAATEGKVIALMVYPKDLRNEEQGIYGGFEQLAADKFKAICKMYSLPVFKLGDKEDLNKLVELSINYFMEE